FSKSYKNPAGRIYPLWLSLIDERKRLWCGSRYGVYLFDKQNRQFDNYFFKPSDNSKSYITRDIFEDAKTGLIFMAEQGADGLHYFYPARKQFSFLLLPVDPLKDLTVNSIFQPTDGKIWIVCPYGLFKLSNDRKKIIPVIVIDESYPWLQEMLEDRNGNIWISSLNSGLQRVNLQSGKLEKPKNWRNYFEGDRNVPDILHLQLDKDNRIWFIRQYGGYGYYDIERDSVHYFFRPDSNDTGFYHLTCYARGKDNIIWAGDWENGLGYINPDFPEKGVQAKSSTENGLQSNTVYNIRHDDKDRLWMLTGAGLEMFDPATGQTALFNQNDGIITYDTFSNRNSYIPGSFERLSDGRMVIGYRRGLGFFHPDSLVTNKEIPIPYLTSVKVYEKENSSDTALFYSKGIDLVYHQNFLTFEYSAISLTIGSEVIFYHQLEGIDRDWVQSSRRFASYSNLAPGNYTFRVKTQSGYNLWSDKPVVFDITIHPPWWKTWWAYALYILVIGGAFFGFYRFQLNRQLALREASRLKELDEIKSQLYANITHEFRTPLTVITGMADEIKSQMKPGEQSRFTEFLDMIKRNAGSLLHLVSQMLDLSKLESGKLELKPIQADVVPYLQYITESFQSFAESKGIKLVFYNETEKVIMDYDPDKLFTIISNLLSNAIKFTRKGGKVICHLHTSGKLHPGNLILKIKDTGIGIPEDMLPNIFNRFFQIDSTSTRKGEGTGIGLSLAKELVELMKGCITVKSQEGKGSEFTVHLPVTRNAQKQVSKFDREQTDREISDKWPAGLPAELMTEELPGSDTFDAPDHPLTLIVEDNKDVAKYIALCLGEDYSIHHAKDGQEGIDKALELIPDIIICDVMMPEKDGFEVCSFLKQDERTSHIPIIMLTAKTGRDDRLEGLMSGADAYLAKPFDKKELLVRIEKMIALRKLLHEKFSAAKYELKSSLSPDNIEDLFLKKAIHFIENNIDDSDFGSLQLARSISMSESQLYRKLKALTGKSTALFIRSIRLQKAKELLKTTTLNVSEVAYETGFSDPAWFSRAFKEEFGESPGAHRDK
ncbi:MAG: response regulator, partial [Bacteroidales bacterium]|nr:response regulator [Bacteroidales bacterium]